jgi:UDP-2,4-diacetamido-2,4,6-trideoxy-beta-L-altropyranose hydrolase
MYDAAGSMIVRADAGSEFGTGHVMRCLALAQAWEDAGGNAHFLSVDPPNAIHKRVVDAGCDISPLAATRGSGADADETVRLARKLGAQWVVADGYRFDVNWQRTVRESNLRLLVVDDYGHLPSYDADILMNQNVEATADTYPDISSSTVLLTGNRYALLRREFSKLEQPRSRDVRLLPEASRVLVSLGGSDPDDVTGFVLDALERLEDPNLAVIALVGGANPRGAELRERAGDASYGLRVEVNSTEPARHMQWADVAVSAGGSTTWELAYLGVPTCHIVIAENQIEIARHTEQRGFSINLGAPETLDADRVANSIGKLLGDVKRRESMSRSGQAIIDGQGARRVVEAMRQYEERTRCVSRAS